MIYPKKTKYFNTVESKQLKYLVEMGKLNNKIIIYILNLLMSNTPKTCKNDQK